jgi:hypothetical protein
MQAHLSALASNHHLSNSNIQAMGLPFGPLSKEDWVLEIMSHFDAQTGSDLKVWELLFQKMVEGNHVVEDQLGYGKFFLIKAFDGSHLITAFDVIREAFPWMS